MSSRLLTAGFSLISLLFRMWFSASLAMLPLLAAAEEFSSANFIIRDPVFHIASSTEMQSSSYRLIGTVGQISIGTSTSATFEVRGGFLYFPKATSPVVTATAGDGQVSLSWTASQGFLGWNVSGYNVGRATVSGGPYTFTSSLGNVLSHTATGLTNGTTYYFIVRAEDAFQNVIATSSEVSATPVAAAAPAPTPGVGGGGGGILITPPPPTRIVLKGRAYPEATVTIFKDGSTVATIQTDSGGFFQSQVDVVAGIYTFSLYAIDKDNRRSLTTSFTTSVSQGFTNTISDIVIAPTIGSDKSQVKQGNDIKFFGYAFPHSQVDVVINSEEPIIDQTQSDKFGFWDYLINSGSLKRGDHTIKSRTITPDKLSSPFSESLAFSVGDTDILVTQPGLPTAGLLQFLRPRPEGCRKNGDINRDGKVNIVDFSILLFFWNQRNPKNACADINTDGQVNLFDFSIMLFWWSG